MNKFLTSLNITDSKVSVKDVAGVTQTKTEVTGEFTFDGRLRSGQHARFAATITEGKDWQDFEVGFTVMVVKAKHTQWRAMKACTQHDQIKFEVARRVKFELKENTQENEPDEESFPEFDVETERALALEAFAEVNLNEVVASAAVMDSKDPLEIPNFLKRS
jgi:hypothetical protein